MSNIKQIIHFQKVYSKINPPPVLIFGDSVFLRVANDESEKLSIKDILSKKLGSQVAQIVGSGYNPRLFAAISKMFLSMPYLPELVILPINLRSFSPTWDYNPEYQFYNEIFQIQRFNSIISFRFYLNIYKLIFKLIYTKNSRYMYCRNIGKINCRDFNKIATENPDYESYEWKKRLKSVFGYHYTYFLNSKNRQLQFISNVVKIFQSLGVKVYSYLTPINFIAGEKYYGRSFMNEANINLCKILEKIYNSQSLHEGCLINPDVFAFKFKSSIFFTEHNATEHLRNEGRTFLANRIIDEVNKI